MPYTIKKLFPADLDQARQLLEEWYRDDGIINPRLPSDVYLQKLMSRESFHVYVALEGEQVIGGLSAYELDMFDEEVTEMFIFEIGVNKHHRKRGVARMLIEALEATCREKGIKVAFVATFMDNEAARQLYTSTGGTMEVVPLFTYNWK